jgi:hypothetical protein
MTRRYLLLWLVFLIIAAILQSYLMPGVAAWRYTLVAIPQICAGCFWMLAFRREASPRPRGEE